jgi:hypothetical protein
MLTITAIALLTAAIRKNRHAEMVWVACPRIC